ncbi:hypothetical protein OPV22_023455 [Ensete ventricosum]|uniref:BHLH domain-containing protein n=1 Tax=Ensete ventricosum TaxID=4639 RepID=A0AAV8QWZ1_ENSVE|nr:hypothetical protein OPV22_023455 [Ensete ventricosum]
MNRGAFQSYLVQQQMEGGPTWWSMKNMKPPAELTFPLLPSSSWSSSSSPVFPEFAQPSSTEMTPWQHSQDLPESWYQLLLGGIVGEEEKYGSTPFETKKMEICADQPDQVPYPSATAQIADVKRVPLGNGNVHSRGSQEIQVSRSAWSRIPPASSPRSCITTSFSTNMLDFSNNSGRRPENSSECNSTETAPASKKVRVQGSSSPKSILKVRKEKLGDRITALHQLVSPFGKTDTASVLQEAIGYIRFLQCQIEALSSPYLSSGTGNMRLPAQGNTSCLFSEDPGQSSNGSGKNKSGTQEQERNDEAKKDLRSQGLCLVPVSFTMHVGSDDGAGFWAPTLGGGF